MLYRKYSPYRESYLLLPGFYLTAGLLNKIKILISLGLIYGHKKTHHVTYSTIDAIDVRH